MPLALLLKASYRPLAAESQGAAADRKKAETASVRIDKTRAISPALQRSLLALQARSKRIATDHRKRQPPQASRDQRFAERVAPQEDKARTHAGSPKAERSSTKHPQRERVARATAGAAISSANHGRSIDIMGSTRAGRSRGELRTAPREVCALGLGKDMEIEELTKKVKALEALSAAEEKRGIDLRERTRKTGR